VRGVRVEDGRHRRGHWAEVGCGSRGGSSSAKTSSLAERPPQTPAGRQRKRETLLKKRNVHETRMIELLRGGRKDQAEEQARQVYRVDLELATLELSDEERVRP
jgi:hypothetical protein